jgi:hypothetical protein
MWNESCYQLAVLMQIAQPALSGESPPRNGVAALIAAVLQA